MSDHKELVRLRAERKAVVNALNEAASVGHFDGYDEDTELLRSITSHWNRLSGVYAKETEHRQAWRACATQLAEALRGCLEVNGLAGDEVTDEALAQFDRLEEETAES